ncbi:MAG: AIR synthase family protein [Thermoprotei archaeon]|jgi:hydrogenase maturation factor
MSSQLPIGKLDPRLLEDIVFKHLGSKRKEVLIGPGIGVDAALLQIDNTKIVFKSDPIVGASHRIGQLAINVVSNDVACMGAKPIAATLVILLPEDSDIKTVEEIMKEADNASKTIDVAIVGGHTEIASGLRNRPPIIIASAIGVPISKSIISVSNASPGDYIIMTKTAGLEGTAIIAETLQERLSKILDNNIIKRAQDMINHTSILKEALTLAERELVSAMHDPTDGGILEGLYEMSKASNTGLIVYEEKIPVAKETKIICDFLKIDPLKLISSGVLLAAVKPEKVNDAINILNKIGIQASVIGYFTTQHEGIRIIRKNNEEIYIDTPVIDELWKLFPH